MNSIWKYRTIPFLLSRHIKTDISRHATSSLVCCRNVNNGLFLENVGLKSKTVAPVNLSYNSIRHKSKKQQDQDSDDEDNAFDDDASLSKDSKVVKFSTTSLRTDMILKSALGIARNKIEQLFYESRIRVNGKKILKKSAPIRIEYEIDIIKGVSPKNPDHLYVSRVEILNLAAKEENIVVTARRFKNLLIENYEIDPYKASADTGEN